MSDSSTGHTEPHSGAGHFATDHFADAASEATRQYGRFNLAVVGQTGAGKSSLVNAVFGRDLAPVGMGLPVTRGVHYYHDERLGIWDFEGFEIGSAEPPADMLRRYMDAVSRRPADEQIAVVWYCVTASSGRFTDADIEMVRRLGAAGLPVIVVLTKVDWSRNPVTGRYQAPADVDRFRDWLEDPHRGDQRIDVPIRRVLLTSTRDANGKGTGHGLGELVDATLALSPHSARDAFRIAQQLNLAWKRDMARRVIAAGAAAAAAAAAVPLPVADAVTLAPIQMAMMGRVCVIYDLQMKAMLSTQALAQMGAQVSGQALARSFVKLIPGAGSVINAGVASAITSVTGEGWRVLCERVHRGDIDVSRVGAMWDEFSPSIVSIIGRLAEQKLGGTAKRHR